MSCLVPLRSIINSYVVIGSVPSVRRHPTDEKIALFASDSPFNKASFGTVRLALEWRRKLFNVGFSDVDAFPGHDGEILISGLTGPFCFEATIDKKGRISVTFEKGDDLVFSKDRLTPLAARSKLFEAARLVWISSVGFTRNTLTLDVDGLPVLPSITPQTKTAA